MKISLRVHSFDMEEWYHTFIQNRCYSVILFGKGVIMRQKLASFFYGRYGSDKLNLFRIIVYLILEIAAIFIPNLTVKIILWAVSLALFVLVIFRMLSRNLAKRRAENDLYLKLTKGIREWFLLQKNKWKYRRTHVYRTCPSCRAKIRLKKIQGEHSCICPRCGKKFDVKIK